MTSPSAVEGGDEALHRESDPTGARGHAWRAHVGMFAISTALLDLEILETKILAYSLDIVQVYLAIGICLLGLGASGTVLALFPARSVEKARRQAGAFAVAAAFATLAAHWIFAQLAWSLSDVGLATFPLLIALTAPYFCMGMTIALLLAEGGGSISRAYALNLAGSGAGCLIVFPVLDALGAEQALLVVAGIALVAAFALCELRRMETVAATLGVLAIALAWRHAEALFPFPPDPSGQLSVVLRALEEQRRAHPGETVEATRRFHRWDRTARVDVYGIESSLPRFQTRLDGPFDAYFYTQDASAGSILLGVRDDPDRASTLFDETLYGAGYALGRARDVLIIGLGGSPDIIAAHHFGAETITGVEINATAIHIGSEAFRDFLGDPYGRPNVEIHHMDGRSFVRSTDRTYDLIQMSGVDTKALLASGSLSVNESYLYTREAMGEMISRLRDDGVLAIIRIHGPRLASVAAAALEDMGVEAPERHLFAIKQSGWIMTLIKRTPFEQTELNRLHRWVRKANARRNDISFVFLRLFDLDWSEPMEIIYSPQPRYVARAPLHRALGQGRLDEHIERAKQDLSPPDDDRPFFFFFQRPRDALLSPTPALRSLYWTIAQLALISAVFTLTPLVVLRRRGLAEGRARGSLVYFGCLGTGFMLLEIGLIQRFVLLLGHQSYAVSVVLFGFMTGAMLGSLFSARLSITSRRPLATALAVLVATILAYSVVLSPLFDAAAGAGFALRLLLALTLLIGLGFLLGIPFPTALRALHLRGSPLVAWAIGINGFASVIGSSVAVPAAMLLGFRALLLVAASLYGVALLFAPVGDDRPRPS